MRALLASTPLLLIVLVATMLALALAGLAGEIVRFIRDDWPMYSEFRASGRSRAQAWRMARRV